PATMACAHARIARMICADLETSTADERRLLATEAFQRQNLLLMQKLSLVMKAMSGAPRTIVSSASGSFLFPAILDPQSIHPRIIGAKGPRERQTPRLNSVTRIALRDKIGATASDAACAYAVAILAEEQDNAVR